MQIQANDKIIRNEEPLSNEIDGEKVMMSIEQGKYFGLNTVGSFIWELTKEAITLEEIINKLQESYNVDYKTCSRETLSFLEQLKEKKLIRIEKQ